MSKTSLNRDYEVLRKLARAEIGAATVDALDKLKKNMMKYARNLTVKGDAYRSHEGVRKWFIDKAGIPEDVQNYRFLQNYTAAAYQRVSDNNLDKEELQKRSRIFSVVDTICRQKIREFVGTEIPSPIQFASIKNGILSIEQSKINHSNNEDFLTNSQGFYETLRQPTVENDAIVTRELIQIYTEHSVVFIRWYFRFSETSVLSFRGHYILSGDAAYFLLHSEKNKGRMRVLVSSDLFWKEARQPFTTGILLSQKPYKPDPAHEGFVSRTVFIRKIADNKQADKFADSFVRRVSKDDLDDTVYAERVWSTLFEGQCSSIDV